MLISEDIMTGQIEYMVTFCVIFLWPETTLEQVNLLNSKPKILFQKLFLGNSRQV